jgi:hypothetical protein
MKTNKNTKNENTRINSIIRSFFLVALSGVATLNVLKAGDPESEVIERSDYETNYLSHTGTKRTANSEDTFIIEGFDVFKEYNGIPVNFRPNLLEYRLQLALEEEPDPEMEIEEWMVDLSYWNVLAKEKTVAVKSSKPDEEFSNTLSEYKVTVALQEEPEPEMEIEDWMLDIDEFIQQINFAKR